MNKRDEKIIRPGRSLTWQERISMIQEYLTGRYTKSELWRKYTGQQKYNGYILKWMRQYGYTDIVAGNKPNALQEARKSLKGESKLGYIAYQENEPMKKRKLIPDLACIKQVEPINSEKELVALQAYNQELKKKLEDAQLKLGAYELMIDIAEKEFKIPIRKKSNTK